MNKRSVVSAGILALSVLMIGIGVANKEQDRKSTRLNSSHP